MTSGALAESATERRLRLVRQHGYNGLALLTLYDGWRYFESPNIDGFIPYELHRSVAVACGDPVCAEGDLGVLVAGFVEYCHLRGWRFAMVGTTPRVAQAAAKLHLKPLKIGEEALFDLSGPMPRGKAAKRARWAVNKARRSGVAVEEYGTPSKDIDDEIQEVADEWLETRKGPPMSYLLRSRPLSLRGEKRVFVARHGGRIVGIITCSPAPARKLLQVEEQLRRQDAPYGTSELLVEVARTAAARDGYRWFSLGVSPLQGAERQPYGRFRLPRLLFAFCQSRINFLYNFSLLNRFKKKFGSSCWEDSFLVYQNGLLPVALGLVTAFSPDGIPSLLLPRRLQWLRFVPTPVFWLATAVGVALATFAVWEFAVLRAPLELVGDVLPSMRLPASSLIRDARVVLLAHRMLASIALVLLAGGFLWRRHQART